MNDSTRPVNCPVCRKTASPPLFFLQTPVNCSTLYRTREEAQAARIETLALAACHTCGLIFNPRFNPSLIRYDADYDNSLHFSPAFRAYSASLVDYLIKTYDLRGKTILEIGCGKGEFLTELCEREGNRGIGFDPSSANVSVPECVVLFPSFYSPDYRHVSADGVCCRHVLEHIADPLELLATIHTALSTSPSPFFYCEVPAAEAVLSGSSIWDVIYPHCNYFTSRALTLLLHRTRFSVLRVANSFDDQFLASESVPVESAGTIGPLNDSGDHRSAASMLRGFAFRFDQAIHRWAALLENARLQGQRVALWGAGARAVTFLNRVPGARDLSLIVDSNPRKHGMFVPGTGQRISEIATLSTLRPDAVIILNPVYQPEISRVLSNLLPGVEEWISVDGLPQVIRPEVAHSR